MKKRLLFAGMFLVFSMMAAGEAMPTAKGVNMSKNAAVKKFPEDLSYQRESNLLQGIEEWLPVGQAEYRRAEKGFLLKNGILEHFLDWDNAEHAAQDCTFPVDKIMMFTVQAKGKGRFRLGCDAVRMGGSFSDFTMTTRFTRHTEAIYSQEFDLTDQVKSFTFSYQEKNPGTIGHPRVFVEACGDSEVNLLSASMVYKAVNDFRIVFEPNYAVAVPGDKVSFTIHCDKRSYPLRICIYDGHHAISNGMETKTVVTDENGIIKMSVDMVSASFEGMRITASDPQTGVKKSFFITEVSPALKSRLQSLKLTEFPFHRVLFLGDSLTDYDRGRNYADLVKLALPKGVSCCNAGVGGDYIGRSLERLKGEKCFASERYDGIFDVKPDLVFIFLGANDTKTGSGSKFTKPMTSPELQYKQYKEFLACLRAKCQPGVRFVFILHTPGFYQDQEQSARRRVLAGKSAARFNEEKHILNYNKVLRQVAEEEGAGIVDAYSPMLQYENRRELFISNDGIHMTLKGHCFMAELLLKHLHGDVYKSTMSK